MSHYSYKKSVLTNFPSFNLESKCNHLIFIEFYFSNMKENDLQNTKEAYYMQKRFSLLEDLSI